MAYIVSRSALLEGRDSFEKVVGSQSHRFERDGKLEYLASALLHDPTKGLLRPADSHRG